MRVLLNVIKRENYYFYDDESGLVLDRKTLLGEVDKPTKAIIRGVKYCTLVDVDNELNIEIPEKDKVAQQRLLIERGIVPNQSSSGNPITYSSKENIKEDIKETVKKEIKEDIKEEVKEETEKPKKRTAKKKE